MLVGFSIFYPGDIQEMIADSKKYLALKLQSSCGNSKEPTSATLLVLIDVCSV